MLLARHTARPRHKGAERVSICALPGLYPSADQSSIRPSVLARPSAIPRKPPPHPAVLLDRMWVTIAYKASEPYHLWSPALALAAPAGQTA